MENWKTTSLAERLRYLCDQVGGPSPLAALLGIHRSSLLGYLKGRVIPPTSRLHLIAAIFPCSLDWLEKGEGEAPMAEPERTLTAREAKRARFTAHREGLASTAYEGAAHGSVLALAKQRDIVLLEPTREGLRRAIKTKDIPEFEKVLGPELTRLVLSGEACPSLELMARLEPLLGPKLAWILGLED